MVSELLVSTLEIGGKSHFYLIYCKVITCFFLLKIKKNCLFSSTLRLSRPIIWTQNEYGATTRSHPVQVFLEFVEDRKALQPRPPWGLNMVPPLLFRSRKFGDIFFLKFCDRLDPFLGIILTPFLRKQIYFQFILNVL